LHLLTFVPERDEGLTQGLAVAEGQQC